MKLKWVICLSIICLGITGCSSSTKSEIGWLIHDVKESVEDYNKYKDIEVHTEAEMKQFALNCLKDKYGMLFVLDDRYTRYKHEDGHEEKPMILRARAYPEGKENYVCALYVAEPNIFKDNYSVNMYRQDIEEFILPKMEQYGVQGCLKYIDYPLMFGTVREDLSVEDFLSDRNTCLRLCQYVEKEEDVSSYIPLIRKWLDYLYTVDYDFYFSLDDKEDTDYQYFGFSRGDHQYTSSDDWTDEEILEDIEICMRMND